MKRLLLALLLTVAFAVPAFSQMKGMDMKGAHPGHGQPMEICVMDKMADMMGMCLKHAQKLGLSEDQVAQLSTVHRAMEKKQLRNGADSKIAEIELMEIMEVKDFDLVKAGAAVQKISDLQTAHRLEMLKAMKEARSILTEEQFKKMKKMMHAMADGNMSRHMSKKHK